MQWKLSLGPKRVEISKMYRKRYTVTIKCKCLSLTKHRSSLKYSTKLIPFLLTGCPKINSQSIYSDTSKEQSIMVEMEMIHILSFNKSINTLFEVSVQELYIGGSEPLIRKRISDNAKYISKTIKYRTLQNTTPDQTTSHRNTIQQYLHTCMPA